MSHRTLRFAASALPVCVNVDAPAVVLKPELFISMAASTSLLCGLFGLLVSLASPAFTRALKVCEGVVFGIVQLTALSPNCVNSAPVVNIAGSGVHLKRMRAFTSGSAAM